MRVFMTISLGCLLSINVFAQRGGHVGGGRFGGGHIGSGFARGGGFGHFGGGVFRGGYGVRRGGFGFSRGVYGYRGGRGWGWGGYWGRWYPYYGLSFSYYPSWYPYDYGYPGSADYYSYPPSYGAYDRPIYSQPTVVVNQGSPYAPEPPAQPEVREEAPARPPSESGDYQPVLYLIAFKDHDIRPALTYWVEDRTLHYVTIDRRMKEVALASIDRELSERLNRERNMTFRLPPG